MERFIRHKKLWICSIFFFPLLIIWICCLPKELFPDNYSTVVLTENGEMVGARLAEDGQWRFPPIDTIPHKLERATLLFEDQHFYRHPGVNPLAIARAVWQNLREGHVVSGGSTITLQVVRMSRGNPHRTLKEKVIEAFIATRLEAKFSKKEILSFYTTHAPYGGNTVGIQTAAWRYFQRSGEDLSWAEAALLAVLPNSPALLHIERNQEQLLRKRNRLLQKLMEEGEIDEETFQLSIAEPLPEKTFPLQTIAPHLVDRIQKSHPNHYVAVTLQPELQKKAENLLANYHRSYEENEVHNLCALIMETNTGKVLAYCGNADYNHRHNNQVDIITARRSSGSVLKPILFNAMIEDGLITPWMLIPDIPIQIAGYRPQNFDKGYNGAVPACDALARSLNIPAVLMLRQYGIPRFLDRLQRSGLSTIQQSADHYGLTLILGGAEVTLWEITGVYAAMGRTLNRFTQYGNYSTDDLHAPQLTVGNNASTPRTQQEPSLFHAPAVWHTMEALTEVNRPGTLKWRHFVSPRKVAWKTGTSFGNRDAWAIGVTPEYTIGVWIGNANGEGRPELTGVTYAAPLMFELFNILPSTSWFRQPTHQVQELEICPQSGFKRGINCPDGKLVNAYVNCQNAPACPYHQIVHLSRDERHRVSSQCESPSNMIHKPWFVLPPTIESYYRKNNLSYKPLPPYKEGCADLTERQVMEFIYPRNQAVLYIPTKLTGEKGEIVFEVAHQNPKTTLYWHLDNTFVGETTDYHQQGVYTTEGTHTLTIVDTDGNILEKRFRVVGK